MRLKYWSSQPPPRRGLTLQHTLQPLRLQQHASLFPRTPVERSIIRFLSLAKSLKKTLYPQQSKHLAFAAHTPLLAHAIQSITLTNVFSNV